MEKKLNLYWMRITFGQNVYQKVCEYLRKHHAEHRQVIHLDYSMPVTITYW